MMSAENVLDQIKSRAEQIKNNEPQRFPDAASVGDYWRQGDLYITKLAAVPSGAIPVKRPSHQLAPGNTKGSRHCLDSLDGVTVYAMPDADALTGPVLHLARERTIPHPEHGTVICPPGTYGITYQRAYAEELRRVQD